MHASPGDWLQIKSERVDHVVRRGRIVEVHGPDGEPPYIVHWTDSDHETLIVPGPDASVISAADLAEHDRAERERLAHLQEAILNRRATP